MAFDTKFCSANGHSNMAAGLLPLLYEIRKDLRITPRDSDGDLLLRLWTAGVSSPSP